MYIIKKHKDSVKKTHSYDNYRVAEYYLKTNPSNSGSGAFDFTGVDKGGHLLSGLSVNGTSE